MRMWFVEADNALGSRRGDVDDGFAIAALVLSGARLSGLGSVFGNTSEADAHRNNAALARLCGFDGPLVRGAPRAGAAAPDVASHFARLAIDRVLALGPLTSLGWAAREGKLPRVEIVVVGANRTSRGRWPPLWPFEFNLTQDRRAARAVFESGAPLTFVPLDVARRLRVDAEQVAALPGPVGRFLADGAKRWWRRARWLYGARNVPVWDLVAAYYALEPARFRALDTTARFHANGWVELGRGERPVRVVQDFDPDSLWASFERLLESFASGCALTPQS